MPLQIIAGRAKGLKLAAPEGMTTRPTSAKARGSLFNKLTGLVEGARFLDLFAGAGAVGLEAASRGAAMVTFVEMERNALRCISKNLDLYSSKAGRGPQQELVVHAKRVEDYLRMPPVPFDLAWADPPYHLAAGLFPVLCEALASVIVGGGRFVLEAPGELASELAAGVPSKEWELKKINQLGRTVLVELVRTGD